MIPFLKMQALMNDFVVLDYRDGRIMPPPDLLGAMTHRRLGIGCDQVVCLLKPRDPTADCQMRIFNAPDGSEAQTCGNAARCVALMLMEESGKGTARIESNAYVMSCWAVGKDENDESIHIAVDMGIPYTESDPFLPLSDLLPDAYKEKYPEFQPLEPEQALFIDMGNPHCVVFVKTCADIPVRALGSAIEKSPIFSEGTNVEFIEILDPQNLRMRVWERGAGETPACGSGACASVVAAILAEHTARHCTVHLDGGTLDILWREQDEHVIMTGSAKTVFYGKIDPDVLWDIKTDLDLLSHNNF